MEGNGSRKEGEQGMMGCCLWSVNVVNGEDFR